MTAQTCRCGCGRHLRKNNTSGWSGYCNPARYAAGDRPARGKSPEPEETTMACPECKSPTCHKATCSRRPGGPTKPPPAKKPAGLTPEQRAASRAAAIVAGPPDRELTEKSVDDLVALRNRVTAELHRRQLEAEAAVAKLREVLGEAA